MSWKDISRKDMREDCWEHFSIECRKSKADVITTANQKKGKYPEEPMRNQRKTVTPPQARETQAINSWFL